MNRNQVAKDVRVRINSNWKSKASLSDKYTVEEPVIYISESEIFNDVNGFYVRITGGSRLNSSYAYLNELDLEFPINETPLYSFNAPQNDVVKTKVAKAILNELYTTLCNSQMSKSEFEAFINDKFLNQ